MESQPLVLSMENISGEEVTLSIEPTDDFQTFLDKAKSLLGFEVDINSVTRNQPVSLTDNIYQYLLNSEHGFTNDLELSTQSLEQILEPTDDTKDLVYILDDGTQINASQIHFDNEDDIVDLTAEKIPFIKHADDDVDYTEVEVQDTRKFNIVDSPVAKWSQNADCSFVNSLPFKLVCNNTSGFEAQFTKYLEGRSKTYTTLNPVTVKDKSPRSLIRDNYKAFDVNKAYEGSKSFDSSSAFSREDVLNMFKDSPVASIPSDNFIEKRRHVRKTDPARPVFKKNDKNQPISYIDVDGTLIGQAENQNCFICTKFVENNMEKLYLFDKEDQKIHRESVLKKQMTQLKIICEKCLNFHFKPCTSRSPNQSLNSDEYLVIRNNQQYIFQKINAIDFKANLPSGNFVKLGEAKAIIDKIESEILKGNQDKEFVKVEIGSDGQIINTSIDKDLKAKDSKIKDEGSSSDVEIIEPTEPEIDDNIIDNLEDADEHVKEFLGKYQAVESDAELKCRFCEKLFNELAEVIEHGSEHKHDLEDGEVYPCPLCDYGYANFKWLKGHLKAAHEKTKKPAILEKTTENVVQDGKEGTTVDATKCTPKSSPIATRTRNSNKKRDSGNEKETPEKVEDSKTESPKSENNIGKNISQSGPLIIKTEVKQETLDTSDEEAIWIVQTAEDDEELNEEQLRSLLQKAKVKETNQTSRAKKNQCLNCRQLFITEEMLVLHKCTKRRGRKRKAVSKDDNMMRVMPSDELMKKARKKKDGEPSSDPQVVTCHNCNESFTSKVRLKFHMQFHSANNMLLGSGQYSCAECLGQFLFSTESSLFDHVHFQHGKQRRWQCLVADCGKTFYLRANLTKHSRIHTDTRRYVCLTCGKRFLDKQTLDEHGVTHLQIKPFQCHICMKQLTRRSRLRMHLRAHEEELCARLVCVCAVCRRAFPDTVAAQEHAQTSTACVEACADAVKQEREEPRLSPSSGLVTLPEEQTSQETNNPLTTRIRFEADASAAEAALSALPPPARALIRLVEIEKAFRCEYCEDVFYLEDGLNEHRQIHKGVKNPFTCHICKVSFATYSRCTTHKTTHGYYKRPLEAVGHTAPHSGILGYGGFPVVKHFLCEDCGRSYLHWTYLQVHRRMKHANDNYVYDCTACNIVFPNSWSLAYHKKKNHSKESEDDPSTTKKVAKDDYRIPCRDCDEVLPNKTALYKHRKNKHSTDNKQGGFWCLWCSAHYSSRAGLEAHAKIHLKDVSPSPPATTSNSANATNTANSANTTNHRCSVCARSLRSVCEHLRGAAERPHACDVCGIAFRRSTAMRNHRLIHTGVRAWQCPRCSRRFRIRSDLRAHVRLKHPETIVVIEVASLNPTPAEIMSQLANNDINTDKIIDINKISFQKGTSSIKPCTERTLSLLAGLQRVDDTWNTAEQNNANVEELLQPVRLVRAPALNPRLPAILQRASAEPSALLPTYPLSSTADGQEQTDINVQLLLSNDTVNMNDVVNINDAALSNDTPIAYDGSMIQLQLDDNLLMQGDKF